VLPLHSPAAATRVVGCPTHRIDVMRCRRRTFKRCMNRTRAIRWAAATASTGPKHPRRIIMVNLTFAVSPAANPCWMDVRMRDTVCTNPTAKRERRKRNDWRRCMDPLTAMLCSTPSVCAHVFMTGNVSKSTEVRWSESPYTC
jgi:hypothetical protein